jgi:hypothetical protein
VLVPAIDHDRFLADSCPPGRAFALRTRGTTPSRAIANAYELLLRAAAREPAVPSPAPAPSDS